MEAKEVTATVPTGASPSDLVPAAEFNVREFARTAVGSHRSSLDLGYFTDHPLTPDAVVLVDYLAGLERSTLQYLRGVLVTPTHKDARVTAFLVTWAYEKYWIADALEAIVNAHPQSRSSAADRPHPVRKAFRALAERVQPIRESIVANALGEDVVAVHTMTGAIDEWVTQVAYARLAERAGNTELTRVVADVLKVKERHELFFAAQSRDRFARSPKAARLARRRLSSIHWPIGSVDQSDEVTFGFYRALLDARTVAEIDQRIDSYPGLSGLRLVHRSAMSAARGGAR